MIVHRGECEDCMYHIDYLSHDAMPHCPGCGDELEPVGIVGSVYGSGSDMRPAARELVEEWRSASDNTHGIPKWMLSNCADDLEEVLSDHGVLTDE